MAKREWYLTKAHKQTLSKLVARWNARVTRLVKKDPTLGAKGALGEKLSAQDIHELADSQDRYREVTKILRAAIKSKGFGLVEFKEPVINKWGETQATLNVTKSKYIERLYQVAADRLEQARKQRLTEANMTLEEVRPGAADLVRPDRDDISKMGMLQGIRHHVGHAKYRKMFKKDYFTSKEELYHRNIQYAIERSFGPTLGGPLINFIKEMSPQEVVILGMRTDFNIETIYDETNEEANVWRLLRILENYTGRKAKGYEGTVIDTLRKSEVDNPELHRNLKNSLLERGRTTIPNHGGVNNTRRGRRSWF